MCPRRRRTYEYPRHVTLLAFVEEWMVPEGAHMALPGGRWALARVYVAIEIVSVFWFCKKE